MLELPPFYRPIEYEEPPRYTDYAPRNPKRAFPPSVNFRALVLAAIVIYTAPGITRITARIVRAAPEIADAAHVAFLEPWYGGGFGDWDGGPPPYQIPSHEITGAYDTDTGCLIRIDGKWLSVTGVSVEEIMAERELYRKACETGDWTEYTNYVNGKGAGP